MPSTLIDATQVPVARSQIRTVPSLPAVANQVPSAAIATENTGPVRPVDLLTAAVAEHHGAVMLHYDADFEHIAATTGQPHAWIVPRGSID
jgi:predicted nucleic acid-binding protein